MRKVNCNANVSLSNKAESLKMKYVQLVRIGIFSLPNLFFEMIVSQQKK